MIASFLADAGQDVLSGLCLGIVCEGYAVLDVSLDIALHQMYNVN